ncbi:hypothetical protein LPJ61_002404 [Coemansia biformis]|uniref:Xylanolytic transcriptional activator regulatory domain-containing protein n=1 Tax=Coemansia biformis TaxID=1286918 RepID=A0A9W8CYP8_9FUNG|nr:hypothetical protein LPJ61_002404 [Coemansia biformis]
MTAQATPPLLKTCVKCGSEKPSCVNCIKYRCPCTYSPSARSLRPRQNLHRPRRPGTPAATDADAHGAEPVHGEAADPLAFLSDLADASLLGGSSFAQLMRPLSPDTQAALFGTATHMQLPATAPLSSPLFPPLLPFAPPTRPHQHSRIPLDYLSQSQQQQQQQQPLSAPTPTTGVGFRGLISTQTPPSHAMPPLARGSSDGGTATSLPAESPYVQHSRLSPTTLPGSPCARQTSAAGHNPDAIARGIIDVIRGLGVQTAGDPASAAPDRIERSGSTAASVSSIGSPADSHSPLAANAGADPRQIEATLPQLVPDSLDNMLKAYFRYQYPSSGIVLEEFFWYRYYRNMLTPLIIYAMLAVATWNLASDEDDEGGGTYGTVHEVFYRVAKQFVEDAMDEAHLRSVQGLLVLANYEALVGRWGTMWNHTTMARRLAEGIIFRDTDFPWSDVQQDEFDFEYQRVRRAYWHSLINDIWASVLMDKQIGGIEILLPPMPTYDFTYRNIRLLHLDTAPGYRVSLGPEALRDPQLGGTAACGELFLLIGGINNVVFLFQHASQPPPFKTFIDYEMRLTDWYLSLPENVRLNESTIAQFTATAARADLGEVISMHIFWNFARLLLMRMGLVLSLGEDPSLLRNIFSTQAFYTTDSSALQFYQASMPILTPDKAASYDEWLFHFCRCMCLQSSQNVVNLLKLGEHHCVHPGHFGAGLSLPLVQVVSVSMGLVSSPDPQVVRIALDHLLTVIRTLLRLKHWFNTALLLLHLFLSMQDPGLVLPASACVSSAPSAAAMDTDAPTDAAAALRDIEASCPFPAAHLITELMRRLHMPFEQFVKETIRAVRMSSPTKDRVDPCISPLLRHLPEQLHVVADAAAAAAAPEPEWFKYAPSYLRSAWKRLVRSYRSARADAGSAADGE